MQAFTLDGDTQSLGWILAIFMNLFYFLSFVLYYAAPGLSEYRATLYLRYVFFCGEMGLYKYIPVPSSVTRRD